MFRSVVGALFALCLAASPAAAEPFTDFVNLCLKNDGRRDAVVSAVVAAGWYRLPDEAVAGAGPDFHDPVAYLSADPAAHPDGMPDDLRMVMVGWGDGEKIMGISGVRLDACVVVMLAETKDAESWSGRLERALGFEAADVDGNRLWVYYRDGLGFRSEAALMELPEEALPGIAKDRGLFFAGLMFEEDTAGMIMAAIRRTD